MRDRIVRWRLPGPLLRVARRILRHLAALRDEAPPRLAAAALSTVWNRWCTERRFQRVGPCVLGCAGQEDSVEHYARCPIVREFGTQFVRLRIPAQHGIEYFTFAHSVLGDVSVLVRTAIIVYSARRVTEQIRRQDPAAPQVVQDMLQQAAREAVRGHSRAMRLLDGPPAAR